MTGRTRATPAALAEAPRARLAAVRLLLTDLDDTLTTGGRLGEAAMAALYRAERAGLPVVVVTGGPGGAGETLARLLPVAAAVAESGAVWFWRRNDEPGASPRVGHALDDAARTLARRTREALLARVAAEVPGARLAHDQDFRAVDAAFEISPGGVPLPEADLARIEALCTAAGLRHSRSSVHVNAWPPLYDKVSGARAAVRDALGLGLDDLAAAGAAAYVGDALNDAPCFSFFPLSFGVANLVPLLPRLDAPPAYLTRAARGEGLAELVDALLAAR
ncbi:MAG TPA: HAD family hydrolase [Myxococcota bacterium]|jgi:hypothetical protein|nr:HAD family hydrolase [Myxococcota bacterium]